jgi:branched-chain amino acid transport system ATP-binding protein
MDVVFSIAERITVMHFGAVIAQGPVDQIKGNPEVMAIYLGEGSRRHVDA